MKKIVIVNYGTGNLYSIYNSLKYIAPKDDIKISNSINIIKSSDYIILPGQGSSYNTIKYLKKFNIYNDLIDTFLKKPLLAICVGKHILFDYSDENFSLNLGLLSGKIIKFNFKKNIHFKIPHIGWNKLFIKKSHPIINNINNRDYFYFAHSYYIQPNCFDNIYSESFYRIKFPSIISLKNIFAVQFHPEKSSYSGLKIYKNFLNWNP